MKILFIILFVGVQLCYSAILNLQCGDPNFHCPEDIQYFTCAIESGFLEWKSMILPYDIEFYNSPVGTVKTQNEFSANVSSKTGSSYMISVLSFPSDSSHNGVAMMCHDFNDGDIGTCIINTTYPNFTVPSNLTSIPMSYSSVLLQWVSNSIIKFGFLYYNINIEPHDIAGNCTEGTCNVTSTQIYLVNMKPLTTYVFRVRVMSCVELGPESNNLTFNITAYKPLLPNKLHICTVYSLTSLIDLACVTWNYSQVADDFRPVLLYFVLQIVDHKGNIDYFNITQSDNVCVPVTQGKVYNITLSGVNYIGESDDNPTKTIETTSFISVETNLIGIDFAVLHITVQWSEPCGSTLDITVAYNIMNTTLNSTIKYQYDLISDKNGSIVVLRELEVNSLYEYQVFVYNTTTLVIKPVNGIFKTLNNITTITQVKTNPSIKVSSSLLITEPYTIEQSRWMDRGSTYTPVITPNLTIEYTTNKQPQLLSSGIIIGLYCLGLVLIFFIVLVIICFTCYMWLKRRKRKAAKMMCTTNALDIKENDAYGIILEHIHRY